MKIMFMYILKDLTDGWIDGQMDGWTEVILRGREKSGTKRPADRLPQSKHTSIHTGPHAVDINAMLCYRNKMRVLNELCFFF